MSILGRRSCLSLACLACMLAAPAQALKPVRGYPAIPSHYGVIYQEVSFQTADSLQLKGWFFPAQDTAGIANDIIGKRVPVPLELRPSPRPYSAASARRGPTIVLCCGDGGNMTFLIFYAYHFFTQGFHVFTFDWRGFGDSDDWPMDKNQLCYAEFLLDYHAAIDFIKKRPEVDARRIGLLGFSTGAYLSFAMLASRNDIAAYAGRALLTSFEDIVPILAKVDPERGFHAPLDYPRALLPIHAADKITIPVFLIVGERDQRTPPWMSERVIQKVKGPKELWIVPGADHGGVSGPELAGYPEFFRRVAGFFERYLKDRP